MYHQFLTMPVTPSDYTVYLCVSFESQNKQRLLVLAYSTLPFLFLQQRPNVFTVRYELNLYVFIFFGLTWQERLQQQFSFSNTGREPLAQKAPCCEVSQTHTEVNLRKSLVIQTCHVPVLQLLSLSSLIH
jgi:hypothetical protein